MKILSLFWHNILHDSISPQNLDGSNSTVSMFRDQIEFILERYTPISITDFMQITTNPDSIRVYIKPPVLLGFDDGFKNVLSLALPILNEFSIPAVFFVIGEVCRDPAFVPWFVEFKHLLRKTEKRKISYGNFTIDLSSREGHLNLGHLVEVSFKACGSESDRQMLLANLAESLSVARPAASDLDEDLRFVRKEELSSLPSDSLLTVSSHAMTHRYLDNLTYDEQVFELEQSDGLLRQHCPAYYPVIAYPGGSFNADTMAVAKRIYKAGFGVFLGSSYRNRYAYPRVGIGRANVNELNYIVSPTRINCILPLKRFFQATGIRRLI